MREGVLYKISCLFRNGKGKMSSVVYIKGMFGNFPRPWKKVNLSMSQWKIDGKSHLDVDEGNGKGTGCM